MKFIIPLLLAVFSLLNTAIAQSPLRYTTAQAHSHNDYEQNIPFLRAYYQQFGSIEADIFLRNDSIFVAHDQKYINSKNTFQALYLKPILEQI
jgi:alkaline phosphatase